MFTEFLDFLKQIIILNWDFLLFYAIFKEGIIGNSHECEVI